MEVNKIEARVTEDDKYKATAWIRGKQELDPVMTARVDEIRVGNRKVDITGEMEMEGTCIGIDVSNETRLRSDGRMKVLDITPNPRSDELAEAARLFSPSDNV